MKKGNEKVFNYLAIILIIIGFILFIVGLAYSVPSREFDFYGLKEYVGGDAYNAIIEASIRGGEISGKIASKAIYICSGLVIMSLGALNLKKNKNKSDK